MDMLHVSIVKRCHCGRMAVVCLLIPHVSRMIGYITYLGQRIGAASLTWLQLATLNRKKQKKTKSLSTWNPNLFPNWLAIALGLLPFFASWLLTWRFASWLISFPLLISYIMLGFFFLLSASEFLFNLVFLNTSILFHYYYWK